MKGFSKSKAFKTLLISIVILLVIIIFTTAAGGSYFASLFGLVTSPAQKISSDFTDSVLSFTDLDSLTSEELKQLVEKLSQENTDLQKQVVELQKASEENERLKTLLGIEEEAGAEYDIRDAAVISRDANDVFYGFSIDKGYLSGISVGDPVITEKGLVGIIDQAYATTSVVKTIFSEDVKVSVIARMYDRESGVLNSDVVSADSGMVKMSYLQNDTSIEIGAIISTSGASGEYPIDITVGRVTAIEQSDYDISKYAMVEPSVDIKNVKDVFVIVGFPDKDQPMPAESATPAANQQDPEG